MHLTKFGPIFAPFQQKCLEIFFSSAWGARALSAPRLRLWLRIDWLIDWLHYLQCRPTSVFSPFCANLTSKYAYKWSFKRTVSCVNSVPLQLQSAPSSSSSNSNSSVLLLISSNKCYRYPRRSTRQLSRLTSAAFSHGHRRSHRRIQAVQEVTFTHMGVTRGCARGAWAHTGLEYQVNWLRLRVLDPAATHFCINIH